MLDNTKALRNALQRLLLSLLMNLHKENGNRWEELASLDVIKNIHDPQEEFKLLTLTRIWKKLIPALGALRRPGLG